MMLPTAEINIRKTSYGDVCDWIGPVSGYAHFSGSWFDHVNRGDVVNIGRLSVRLIIYPVVEESFYMDVALVALARNPLGELRCFLRSGSESVVRFVARFERAFQGFRDPCWFQAKLPFAKWLADRLLF